VAAQGTRCDFLADDVRDDVSHRPKVGRCWLVEKDAAVVAEMYSAVREIT